MTVPNVADSSGGGETALAKETVTDLKLIGFSIEVDDDPIELLMQTDKGAFKVEIPKAQLSNLVYALRFVLDAEEPLRAKREKKQSGTTIPDQRRQGVRNMRNLYEVLDEAQNGEAISELGREFGLTPDQTKAAVTALLPALSMGLKRSTATPEGLGELFGLMGRQPDLYAMYDDPKAAFSREGRAAGNAALARMFGSPEASRAIADQAQQFSGVTSDILKKLLPVLAGILISGLMRSGSGQAKPSAPEVPSEQGGGLIDILRQIFQQGGAEPSGQGSGQQRSPIPPIGDILGPDRKASPGTQPPSGQPIPMPAPTDAGGAQTTPGGDLLSHILREMEKAIREGRLKPVVLGPYEIEIPKQAGPSGSGQSQTPAGDIFGQILRDLLGGKAGQAQGQPASLMDGAGAAVFGDRLEPGQKVKQSQADAFQQVFEQFFGTQRR
jgi:hypothetical protein